MGTMAIVITSPHGTITFNPDDWPACFLTPPSCTRKESMVENMLRRTFEQ